MTSFPYSIDSSPKSINPGFIIQQFRVENPSPYPLYINASGLTPTSSNADYTVQPNSTFISPPLTNGTLTVSTTIVSNKIATVTVKDSVEEPANNIPITTYQFVSSYPGYPVLALNTGDLANLPTIQVDNFDNILVLVEPANSFANNCAFAILMNDNYGQQFVGFLPNSGGMRAYSPLNFPATIQPSIVASNNPFIAPLGATSIRVNVVKTPEQIESVYNPGFNYQQYTSINQIFTYYFGLEPGFFLYEVQALSSLPSNVSFNVNVYLTHGVNSIPSEDTLYAQFVFAAGSLTDRFSFIVQPTYGNVGHYCLLRIEVQLTATTVPLGTTDILAGVSAVSL